MAILISDSIDVIANTIIRDGKVHFMVKSIYRQDTIIVYSYAPKYMKWSAKKNFSP